MSEARPASTRPTSRRASRAQRVDAATPASRNRVVDLLRAAAITIVVLGHWTLMAVSPEGGIDPHGVLNATTWSHPVTWAFQVMPIFFLVGGYSNALSCRSARRRDQSYATWLRTRLRRLGIPLLPLLVAWVIIALVAALAGADPATVRAASQMALIPTWFLAAYLAVIVVTPAMLAAWERFGWASVVALVALAGAIDALSIATERPLLGYPNYLLVWAGVHQLGFAWLDGRLAGAGRRLALAAVGAAGLALLVGLGPYPVSMLTVEADAISNSNPTRVTMAFLGMLQGGLVLLAEPALARLLARPRPWLVTVLVNRRIMTLFLWHLTVFVGVAHLVLTVSGSAAPAVLPEPLSATWWATRPLWWVVLLALTGLAVLVFGRFEEPRPDERPAPALWRPLGAALITIACLAVLANTGLVWDETFGWLWALGPVAAFVGFGIVAPPGRGAGPRGATSATGAASMAGARRATSTTVSAPSSPEPSA